MLDAWGTGAMVRWKYLSAFNTTGATTTIVVGWKRGGELYPFHGAAAVAAWDSVDWFADVLLPSEFIPYAHFYVAAVGDALELVVAGEIETV